MTTKTQNGHVEKSEQEWRDELTPIQYAVLREKATERPFTGEYDLSFDPGTYVALSDALSTHDVGRGRGGVASALRSCPVPVIVGGITSDRLYPIRLQQELAELLPDCSGLDVVDSAYGHDGFLVETEVVGKLIRRTLELAQR